ncbi:MAG: stage V sporulation protein AD [Oscillospiraceae bacterium]|nr:stage V sporulation protein AD [Oscillospiraceae bacterium]
MATRIGKFTVKLDSAPSVLSYGAVASKKESQGPMAPYIDLLCDDPYFGQKTWELAESRMQETVLRAALEKAGLSAGDLSYVFAGDLLNQCIGSHYGLREFGIPFVGLYGACSTMAEGLGLAAMMVEGGLAERTAAVTSSHFCAAERQFRFPLAYGGQRPPTSQWTATGAGGVILGKGDSPPFVRAVTFGCIEDMGVKDISNMGGAMAPAAAQTLSRFFSDTLTGESSYDMILTGDLGSVGSSLFLQLMEQDGYKLRKKHSDCGTMLYDIKTQGVDAGGSGCGCSAVVLCSYILQSMREGKLGDVLFIGTGALMSTVSTQQGQSIPAVAHLVHLSPTAGLRF